MSYSSHEAQVIDWLKETFSLTDDYVVAGNFDGLVATLRSNAGTYGILVDYEGVTRDDRLGVYWQMGISFWFRFTNEAQIESAIRARSDTFVQAIEGNSNLGGRVETAFLVNGNAPEYVIRNEEMYVSAPFTIAVYERTRGL